MEHNYPRHVVESCKAQIADLLHEHEALSAAEMNRLLPKMDQRNDLTSIALSEMGKELVYRGGKHRLAAKCVAA